MLLTESGRRTRSSKIRFLAGFFRGCLVANGTPNILKRLNKWRAPRRQRLYLRRWPRHDASLHLFPHSLTTTDGRDRPAFGQFFLLLFSVAVRFLVCSALCVSRFFCLFLFAQVSLFCFFHYFVYPCMFDESCGVMRQTPETPVRLGHVKIPPLLCSERTVFIIHFLRREAIIGLPTHLIWFKIELLC